MTASLRYHVKMMGTDIEGRDVLALLGAVFHASVLAVGAGFILFGLFDLLLW